MLLVRDISLTGFKVHIVAFLLVLVMIPPACGQIGGLDSEFAGAGARPLSMGGAFLGLADDSTAAEFNPAGIRVLRRPEFAWQFTRTYDVRDEYLPETSLDEDFGIRGEDTNEWTTPSFASFVLPKQKFTLALSQLTTIDFVHTLRDGPYSSRTEASNNAFGLTFATDLKPRLHLGATLRMNRFAFEFEDFIGKQSVSDWSPSFNVGLLWRANKDWSFGTVYKSRQSVDVPGVQTYLPETFGVGVAYHPNDRLRVLADVDYITWSDFDADTSDDFIRNDVIRYHLGGEYLFCLEEERAWFVRSGYMREDSNAFFYNGEPDRYFSPGFPEEPDKDHVTFGLGVATDDYQIDIGIDHVLDGGTILILSMIHYF